MNFGTCAELTSDHHNTLKQREFTERLDADRFFFGQAQETVFLNTNFVNFSIGSWERTVVGYPGPRGLGGSTVSPARCYERVRRSKTSCKRTSWSERPVLEPDNTCASCLSRGAPFILEGFMMWHGQIELRKVSRKLGPVLAEREHATRTRSTDVPFLLVHLEIGASLPFFGSRGSRMLMRCGCSAICIPFFSWI